MAVSKGLRGRCACVLIQLDKPFAPGLVEDLLGRQRYTRMVPAAADEAVATLRALAGLPELPTLEQPAPPIVAS